MITIDIEKSGFTLCVKKPRREPHLDGGVWKAGEGTPEHLGFDSIRKLYAPEGSRVDSSELPFIEYRKG